MANTQLPKDQDLSAIIIDGDVDRLIRWAEDVGGGLARNERLTTSQVRNFFGAVRQIEAEIEPNTDELSSSTYRRLRLLKPKLAYQGKREGRGVETLGKVLMPAIDLVGDDVKRFKRFVEFFEAILAYHKAAGGRDQ